MIYCPIIKENVVYLACKDCDEDCKDLLTSSEDDIKEDDNEIDDGK